MSACTKPDCVECNGVPPYTDEQVAILNAIRAERLAFAEQLKHLRTQLAAPRAEIELLVDYLIDTYED